MSIVQSFIEAHDARIFAGSEVDKGSRLTIPLRLEG
jgi:signal transduction histidine kinase